MFIGTGDVKELVGDFDSYDEIRRCLDLIDCYEYEWYQILDAITLEEAVEIDGLEEEV